MTAPVSGRDAMVAGMAPRLMPGLWAFCSVTDPAEVLKVDDTAPGIAEGVAAGALSVGITLTGNGAALSADALAALDPSAAARARDIAAAALVDAGACATLPGGSARPDLKVG